MKYALVILLVLALCRHAQASFSLDPAHIHYRGRLVGTDGAGVAGAQTVIFSVWQGGAPTEVDSGTMLYKERTTVTPDSEGFFQCWLGSGEVLFGNLKGEAFGLDKTLYLQMIHGNEDDPTIVRTSFYPIHEAYVSAGGDLTGRPMPPPANPAKDYSPRVSEFSPDLVRKGMAVLYPDGRIQKKDGSFIETTGSTTSGIQEFFDHCAAEHVDGYIAGGSEPRAQQVVYRIDSPVRVHPAQGFRLDTGAIGLLFSSKLGAETGLTIDSCMMVDIRIHGIVIYLGAGYAVAVKPENFLPLDSFVGNVVVDTSLHITTIYSEGQGGLLLDGPVVGSVFSFGEINGAARGVTARNFWANKFTCKHIHNQGDVAVLVESGSDNVWEVNVGPDARDPLGIVTHGRNDIWFASVATLNKPGIVLEAEAAGNQFHLMALNRGFINKAVSPTNRFYAAANIPAESIKLGFAMETPNVADSGTPVVNRHPFQATITILEPGSVTNWAITDPYGTCQTIAAPLAAGQCVTLSPGESITVNYADKPPVWKWRAVQ